MGRVVWTEPALEDVNDILRFVAKDSLAYARKLSVRLMEAPRRHADEPRTGWRVPEFEQDHLRELLVRPYRVIYSIRDETCFVVAVVHGSRDLRKVLGLREGEEEP